MNTNYWIAQTDFKLPLSHSIGAVALGLGVDLSDPDNPILRNQIPFQNVQSSLPQSARHSVVKNGTIINSSRRIEASSDYEEALALNAYFKASFGFASFQAALSYASNHRQTEHSVYVILDSEGADDTIETDALTWKKKPDSESIKDPDERLKQLLVTYGSHYLSSIRYAFRISLRGAVQTVEQSETRKFSAAFSAWAVSGGADLNASQQLRQMNAVFSAEVVAESITPQIYANRWIMTSFDDIQDFLSKLRDGTIQVTRAPIEASVVSYWGTLISYPNTRSVLTFNEALVPSPQFGVPKGTVVAWWPTSSDTREQQDPSTGEMLRIIAPPNGWAICDGTKSLPNMVDRFLVGGGTLASLGRTGGSPTHDHGMEFVSRDTSQIYVVEEGQGFQAVGRNHVHQVDSASNLPPFLGVVYIIKL